MVKQTTKYVLMLAVGLAVMAMSGVAFGQTDQAAVEVAQQESFGWMAIAAGLGIGLAAFGGALGMGRAAAQFFDGVSRNPGASDKMFVPFIIALALIEAMVIYALIIAFFLQGNI